MKMWVLNWRFELEVNANQTERVHAEVYTDMADAVRRAVAIANRHMSLYGRVFTADDEAKIWSELVNSVARDRVHVFTIVQLTDSDNLVFELSERELNKPTEDET